MSLKLLVLSNLKYETQRNQVYYHIKTKYGERKAANLHNLEAGTWE